MIFRSKQRRRGRISVFLLISLPALLLIVLLPINARWMYRNRLQQEHATEASVLAACQVLADDRRLLGPHLVGSELLPEARRQAALYAELNPSGSQILQVDRNEKHDPDGDIVFGSWLKGRLDTQADLTDTFFLSTIDAVRVTIRRDKERNNQLLLFGGGLLPFGKVNVLTKATAYFDRHVYGFRPVGGNPIPMLPIAIRSDRTGMDPGSWEHQVERAKKKDEWKWDRDRKRFVKEPDGIYEMHVVFGEARSHRGGAREANGTILQIGSRNMRDMERQFLHGIHKEDLDQLEYLQGKLALNEAGELLLPGAVHFSQPGPLRNWFGLLQSLSVPRDEPRIIPLQSGFRDGLPVICGFVAARVVTTELGGESRERNAGQGVRVVFQATVMSTATALTAQSRAINQYLGRCRLVE